MVRKLSIGPLGGVVTFIIVSVNLRAHTKPARKIVKEQAVNSLQRDLHKFSK